VHALDSPGTVHLPDRLIFAVDDNPGDLLLLAAMLEHRAALSVPVVFERREDDESLLDVLRGAPAPLVCFVGVKLKGVSGFDVLRWIRCQDAFDQCR